jgi:hypothetical protein
MISHQPYKLGDWWIEAKYLPTTRKNFIPEIQAWLVYYKDEIDYYAEADSLEDAIESVKKLAVLVAKDPEFASKRNALSSSHVTPGRRCAIVIEAARNSRREREA